MDPERIDRMYRQYATKYGLSASDMALLEESSGEVSIVGHHRFEVTLSMSGELGLASTYACEPLMRLLEAWLDSRIVLNSCTVVASHPGAASQHIHRDTGLLFENDARWVSIPAYAVSVAFPLIDVDMETGPTALWPGSHHWGPKRWIKESDVMVAPTLKRGDCLVSDYRLIHGGLPNVSDRVRPNLYLVYARPWFSDDVNHRRRYPLDMPWDVLRAAPKEHRELLSRAAARHFREARDRVCG
jgi:ectoine hydroxylase-related dioxygenase (phytanoyl-CoA dioxygenase family)